MIQIGLHGRRGAGHSIIIDESDYDHISRYKWGVYGKDAALKLYGEFAPTLSNS